ncbi:hypothetical protein BKA80DRAFT_114303 [Phyllosticta citrichinensis]
MPCHAMRQPGNYPEDGGCRHCRLCCGKQKMGVGRLRWRLWDVVVVVVVLRERERERESLALTHFPRARCAAGCCRATTPHSLILSCTYHHAHPFLSPSSSSSSPPRALRSLAWPIHCIPSDPHAVYPRPSPLASSSAHPHLPPSAAAAEPLAWLLSPSLHPSHNAF